jgi:hypothetical protein
MAGAYLYALRLNAETKSRVEQILEEALPCDFDPRRTISLPIRASDKCNDEFRINTSAWAGETNCLPFSTYMEMAEVVRLNDPRVNTIILTSEDRRFVDARHDYADRWRFVINHHDVMQGTGDPRRMVEDHGVDRTFLSFMSSLHLQMRGKYFILNCKSNFHKVLRDLVVEGGRAFVNSPVIICMNEQSGKFRICGKFGSVDRRCLRQKAKEIRLLRNQQRFDKGGRK